jgi:hypothetical protein
MLHFTDKEQAEGRQAALDHIYGRTSRFVIPLFLAIAIINHLDRTNLAFAALTMNADLGFDAAVYGLGSSLFFVGFVIFQVRVAVLSLSCLGLPLPEGHTQNRFIPIIHACGTLQQSSCPQKPQSETGSKLDVSF